jgi:hypothetical protein
VKLTAIYVLSLFVHVLLSAPPEQLYAQSGTDPAIEFHARGGLPNFRAKLTADEPVRIAYLGGSITAQSQGWRDQTFQYLEHKYPASSITQVDASLSGTGSTLAAFRLEHDVLLSRPDLLFVEFTVNDTGGKLTQDSIEGIVRQVWKQDPTTDICFVYTVSSYLLPRILSGRIADSTQAAENVAKHYGIPSINFGVEIADLVRSGKMTMQGSQPSSNGVEVFSPDGTHPFAQTGHVHYRDAFVRAWDHMPVGKPAPHLLSLYSKMDDNVLDTPDVIPVDHLSRTGDWKPVHLEDPTGQLDRSLPDVWVAQAVGASLTFDFDGDLFGIFGVKGPDVGSFSISLDGSQPLVATLFDPYSTAGRYRIRSWFSPLLKPGRHHVRVELLDTSIDKAKIVAAHGYESKDPSFSKNVLYIGDILVNGKMLKSLHP